MNTYTEEFKAEIIAKLILGASPTQLSKEYNIPIGTVTSWKSKQINGESPITIAEKKDQIGALLLTYLEKNLQAQIAQLEVFAEKDWLRKQSADDIAILHGVQNDKAIKMIQAFRPTDA